MRKLASFFMVFGLVFGIYGSAFADVANELEIYKDISDSPAKVEITKLQALGIIPVIEGQENFEPTAELDRQTLGNWLAKAAGLKGHTDQPTPEEYAAEAVENGLIESVNGVATYKDVVTGLLKVIGVKEITAPAEQAVELGAIGEQWDKPVDRGMKANRQDAAILFNLFLKSKGPEGKSILDLLGVKEGPVGIVDDVIEEMVTVDGKNTKNFFVTINGTKYPFFNEGKIALFRSILDAKGNQVVQSYVKKIEEKGKPAQEMLIFIQGDGSAAGTAAKGSATEKVSNSSDTETTSNQLTGSTGTESDQAASTDTEAEGVGGSGIPLGTFWTIAVLLMMVVGFWIYLNGHKKMA
ncbi:hypothetical protein [Thermicanus aegyptius]|uniref:hypothetical protein n=1 Tax=Thermicanus aegyptius TaxID=94009 RepID=UPI000413BC09|nr:hypothetical protein [Thermicanus aegyptius]